MKKKQPFPVEKEVPPHEPSPFRLRLSGLVAGGDAPVYFFYDVDGHRYMRIKEGEADETGSVRLEKVGADGSLLLCDLKNERLYWFYSDRWGHAQAVQAPSGNGGKP